MRMENDLIARKLNLLTVFFPALAPSYKEIILNSFDQYSLLKAYVRRIMDSYPGIQAEDHEKLEKALTVFVNRKCEQKGPKKVSTFSTRFHVVSNVFPKYQMLTF